MFGRRRWGVCVCASTWLLSACFCIGGRRIDHVHLYRVLFRTGGVDARVVWTPRSTRLFVTDVVAAAGEDTVDAQCR